MTRAVISYGGGVQSTAMLVLAATGVLSERLGLDVTTALFCNVGDDSEHPDTLAYVREVSAPWAAERGVQVHELSKIRRDGSVGTLWQELHRTKSIGIPIRTSDTGQPMGRRTCTIDYKVRVMDKWLKANGATPEDPVTVLVGISTDEIRRVRSDRPDLDPFRRRAYPLIDLDLDRNRCAKVIADAGLPVPPKSSCFFCPFHRPSQWAEMRRDRPDLFEKAAQLERTLIDRRLENGKDAVYLTGLRAPLEEAVTAEQEMLPMFTPEMDRCDSGHCWT